MNLDFDKYYKAGLKRLGADKNGEWCFESVVK